MDAVKKKVPLLRFPGFEGNWKTSKLREECTFFSGGTPLTTEESYYKGEIPFIKSGEISSEKTEQYISQAGLENSSAKLVNKGDLLFALYGATSGETSISKIDGAINQAVLCIRTTLDTYYLYSYIQKNKSIILSTYLQGGQGNLSAEIVKQLGICYPYLNEQSKIASFLTAVDDKIRQLTRKKELLEQYKKGVMQKIFSREIRFRDEQGKEFPEWEKKKLGKISEIVGGGTPDTANSQYWDGDIVWFTPTEIKWKYLTISSRSITDEGLINSSAKLLPKGTILFTSRATIGDVGIALVECCTNQGFQSFVVNETCLNEFLYYWIIQNKKRFLSKANGSTFLEVSKSEMIQMDMLLPCKKEQEKIANFLSIIDQKIEFFRMQMESLQIWKKGLLQKMFV